MESKKVLSEQVNQQPKGLLKSKTTIKPKSQGQNKIENKIAKRGSINVKEPSKNLQEHLKKLEEKKYQDNQLKELERKRFTEAKTRLRAYVLYHSWREEEEMSEAYQAERRRLLNYFKHRYLTFISIMKESVRAKKVVKKDSYVKPFWEEEESKDRPVKVFSLTGQNTKGSNNLTPEQAIEECQEALKIYRSSHNLSPDKNIFIVIGHYDDIRQELLRRGWIENDFHETSKEGEKFTSKAFQFMYTTKSKDCFRIDNLCTIQHVNHFEGTKALTTKVGLTHNMKNLIWKESSMDIDQSFPQSYDLSDLKGDEFKDFKEDFKFCQVVSFLKQVHSFNQQTLTKNLDRIIIALSICEKRLQVNSDSIFKLKEFVDFEPISDDIHYAIADLKAVANFQTQPWFRKLQKQYKDITEENAKLKVKEILKQIKAMLGNQYSIIGSKNAWILKPGGKSRGRGITIHNKIENIVQAIETSQENCWVIMKYIENPLIILQKKFDIRQWVVVTSWQPLRIFFFDECYLRFTSDNYDPNKLHDRFSNLTNNCVASQSANFNNSVIEGNMWHSSQFIEYMSKEFADVDPDLYYKKIQPQIKQGVIHSILAARESVVHRENAHEMFGYDFMVDTNFNVWLIEVNSSPSMEHSTAVTAKLVTQILTEIPHLVLDCQNGMLLDDEENKKQEMSANNDQDSVHQQDDQQQAQNQDAGSEDSFLAEIERQQQEMNSYIMNLNRQLQETSALSNYEIVEESKSQLQDFIRIDFIAEVTEELLKEEKLIYIEGVGIIHPLIVQRFKDYYNNDLSKIIRECTKNQYCVISSHSKDVVFSNVVSPNEALEIFKYSRKYKEPGSITYKRMEKDSVVFHLQHQGNSHLSALFPHVAQDQNHLQIVSQQIYQSQMLRLLQNHDFITQVKEELIVVNHNNQSITAYCLVQEDSQLNLSQQLLKWSNTFSSEQNPINEIQLLLIMTELMQGLLFLHSRGIYLEGNLQLQNIMYFHDQGLVKLNHLSDSVIIDLKDLKLSKKRYQLTQRSEGLYSVEDLQNLDRENLAKILESMMDKFRYKQWNYCLKILEHLRNNEDFSLTNVILTSCRYLCKNTERLIEMAEQAGAEKLPEKIQRILQYSLYKNQIQSIVLRAENLFESKNKPEHPFCQKLLHKVSYSLLDNSFTEIYPRVFVDNSEIKINPKDQLWKRICIMLFKHPQPEMKMCFRQTLFQMTRCLFDLDSLRTITQDYTDPDLLTNQEDKYEVKLLGVYYSQAQYKLANTILGKSFIKIMEDLSVIIQAKFDESINIVYYYNMMKDLWKRNQFKQSIQVAWLIQKYKPQKFQIEDHEMIIKALIHEAQYYILQQEFHDQIIVRIEQSIQEISLQNNRIHGKYLYLQGIYNYNQRKYNQALEFFQQGYDLYLKFSSETSKSCLRCKLYILKCEYFLNQEANATKFQLMKLLRLMPKNLNSLDLYLQTFLQLIDIHESNQEYHHLERAVENMYTPDQFDLPEYHEILARYFDIDTVSKSQEHLNEIMLNEKALRDFIHNVVVNEYSGEKQFLYKSMLSFFVGSKLNFERLDSSIQNVTKLEDKLFHVHKYLVTKLKQIQETL